MVQSTSVIRNASAASSDDVVGLRSKPLAIDNVSKRFGAVTALENLSLDIRAGELVALLGPSGCGKTTTLRMIAGFDFPDTGAIRIDGRDMTHIPPNKRGIGMVFQSYGLFPHLNVADNISFGLKMAGMAAGERAQHVETMLDLIRLPGFGSRRISEMSGGQQQRVALARAIVTNPSVLLLDEPLGALDRNLREGMQFELKSLQSKLGVTSVMVTHDQEEALTMSDRIVVMNHGRVLQSGTPGDVYDRPRNRFVAEFLGSANIVPFAVTRAASNGGFILRMGPAGHPAPIACTMDANSENGHRLSSIAAAGGAGECAIRPEKVRLGAPRDNEIALRGVVAAHIFRGSQHAYRIDVAALGQTFSIYEQANVGRAHEAGEVVDLAVHPKDVVVLEPDAAGKSGGAE